MKGHIGKTSEGGTQHTILTHHWDPPPRRRFAMVTYGITDIREFYNGDLRFLDQFPHFKDQGMKAFLEGRGTSDVEAEEGGGDKEEKVEKKEKKKADPPAAGAELDISKLEFKVGTITKVWEHPDSDKLWCEEVSNDRSIILTNTSHALSHSSSRRLTAERNPPALSAAVSAPITLPLTWRARRW